MISRLLARLPAPGPIPVTCDPVHAWLLDDGDVIHAGDRLTALLVTLALASPRCVLRRAETVREAAA